MTANAQKMAPVPDKTIKWSGNETQEAVDILSAGGGAVVSPTKVGYIFIVTDKAGLERKFDAKERKRNKPGVVLCGSMAQLEALAELSPEIKQFYQDHWDQDVLLGCILPWKEEAKAKYIPDDGSQELMMDNRGTSCFVIKFGTPSEQIVDALWQKNENLVFASSANPSGKGNKGKLENVGARIEAEADLLIEANDYVSSIQPNESEATRYEQGVMVAMVDEQGKLVPDQKNERGVSPCPILIRKGLDCKKIMENLSNIYPSWDYRQGQYY